LPVVRDGPAPIEKMARHVFPNALYALVVVATLYIATAIRTEASLSFLGLGIPPPTPSWGNILSEGRQYIKCCPWITTFSGLAIMLAVLAFNLMGDALRDLLDPGSAANEIRLGAGLIWSRRWIHGREPRACLTMKPHDATLRSWVPSTAGRLASASSRTA
jgi:Binding-protein-dependent transport system inner membrane component